MFWNKKAKTPTRTIEDGIRLAMERGVASKHYKDTDDPFRWRKDSETLESQLQGLTELAVEFRKDAREYKILYPLGAAYYFNLRLSQFLADEDFKQGILAEATERELEVQRSRALVEAVRAGKDRHPQFLALVDAQSLDDIRRAESLLKRA